MNELQARINAISHERGGGPVHVEGTVRVDEHLHLWPGVWLQGDCLRPGFKRPGNGIEPGALDFLGHPSVIVLGDGGRIILHGSAGLSGVVVVHESVTPLMRRADIDATQTAVEIVGSDATVRDSLILGFGLGVHAKSDRPLIERVSLDCLNGIAVENAWDIPRITGCHIWPFLTVGHGDPRENYRHGFGVGVFGVADWARIEDTFVFGHRRGFWLSGGNMVTVRGCGADGTGIEDGTIGFCIESEADDVRLIEIKAAGHDLGIYGQLGMRTGGPGKVLTVSDSSMWGNQIGYHSGIGYNATRLSGCHVFGNRQGGVYSIGKRPVNLRDVALHDNGSKWDSTGSPAVSESASNVVLDEAQA